MKYIYLLRKYLKSQYYLLVSLLVVVLINTKIMLYCPEIISNFIDKSISGTNNKELLKMAITFIVLILINIGLKVVITYISQKVGWSATNCLREDLVKHCLHLDIAFHKEKTQGELIETIDGDVNNLFNFFSKMGVILISNFLLLIGVLIKYIKIDIRMGIVQIIFSIFVFIALLKLKDYGVSLRKKDRNSMSQLSSFFGEIIENTEDIQGNNASNYVYRRFSKILKEWFPIRKKANIAMWSMFMLLLGLQAMAYGITFLLGTYLWKEKVITVGTIYLFYNYTKYLLDPISTLSQQMQDLQRVGASISRINELLLTVKTISDTEKEFEISKMSKIHISDLYFSYDTETEVLKGINFSICPGHTVAILGKTGCGKSTLVSLIARFYDATQGEVYIDNINIKDIGVHSLRNQIVYVTQDIQLLDATIRNNITFYNDQISDATILNAIKDMGIQDWFSKFPNGLDTLIGIGGMGVSAGESQLLAFIRAFIKSPKIVILDEVTSKLDLETERQLMHAINKLLEGRIGIIIAHRLQTIELVDEIVILEQGVIAEYGDMKELSKNSLSKFCQLLTIANEGGVIYE